MGLRLKTIDQNKGFKRNTPVYSGKRIIRKEDKIKEQRDTEIEQIKAKAVELIEKVRTARDSKIQRAKDEANREIKKIKAERKLLYGKSR